MASACCTCDGQHGGIERGDHLPRFTVSLKSAPSVAMVPLTWVPTSTVSTGASVPVADTDTTIGSARHRGHGQLRRRVRSGVGAQ